LVKENQVPRKVKFRIDRHNAWDNGRILHSYEVDTLENAEEKARQASLENPNDIFYVHLDNIMNPTTEWSWYRGEKYTGNEPEYRQIVKDVNNYYGDKYGQRLESKSRRNRGKKLKEDVYRIVYDYTDEEGYESRDIEEEFEGTWSELQDYIKQMRRNGCYHIDANCISDDY
jgi:hypothetical protein